MKKIYTFLSLIIAFSFTQQAIAQPDLEVTDVYIYQLPLTNPGTEYPGDTIPPGDTVAIGLTMMNNGPTLVIGDTILMGWNINTGGLISALSNDFMSGTSSSFIVTTAQLAPTVLGPWQVSIWPTYSSKGFTNSDSTVGKGSNTFTIYELTTGLDQIVFTKGQNFYADGYLNINLKSFVSQNAEIRVINTSGQTVYQNTAQVSSNGFQDRVDLNGQSKGVYILSIYSQSGVETKKFVVE